MYAKAFDMDKIISCYSKPSRPYNTSDASHAGSQNTIKVCETYYN